MHNLQIEHIIFDLVCRTYGITIHKIALILASVYGLKYENTRPIIEAMATNDYHLGRIFNSYEIPASRLKGVDATLLRPNPHLKKAMLKLFELNQISCKYELKSIDIKQGKSNGSNALKKVGTSGLVPDNKEQQIELSAT